jgi:hypothetical protein
MSYKTISAKTLLANKNKFVLFLTDSAAKEYINATEVRQDRLPTKRQKKIYKVENSDMYAVRQKRPTHDIRKSIIPIKKQ